MSGLLLVINMTQCPASRELALSGGVKSLILSPRCKKNKKTIDFQKTIVYINKTLILNKGKNIMSKKYSSSIDDAIFQAQERLSFYTRKQLESTTIVNEINNLLAFLYNLKKESEVK